MEEKRNCKICFKRFSNGRALAGHMKSHMAILKTPPKIEQIRKQLGNETESASSSSSSEEELEAEEELVEVKTGLYYGLRENPKKSFRLVDPVFSSSAMDVGSIVLDGESETESFKINLTTRRRGSKRNRIPNVPNHHQIHQEQHLQQSEQQLKKKHKSSKPIKVELPIESEPLSSVSDNTPEEDVALCLMMLSRDTWVKVEEEKQVGEKSIEEFDDDNDDEIKYCPNRIRKKYQCESCKKVFRSYQALGGHRANHKKINGCIIPFSAIKAETTQNGSNAGGGDGRIHKCPFCFRMFKSRQALGGHKRIHLSDLATTSTTATTTNSAKIRDNLIDLNLPAPNEDEEEHISQAEILAVSL